MSQNAGVVVGTENALDDWAKGTLGESAEFWRNLAQDDQAVASLLNEALSSARSYCHLVKLSVLSNHLNQLADALPDGEPLPELQRLQEAIDSRRKSPEGSWNDFTNRTSQILSRQWSDFHQALQRRTSSQRNHPSVSQIAKIVASDFASSWDDIIQFIKENTEAHIQNIEQMIKDHQVLFKAIAMLIIAGGSLLVAPNVILALLQLFGFSLIGPIAGSPAAIWQSIHFGASVPKGSLWSLMQKIAMGGLVASTFVELLIGCSLIALGGIIIHILQDGRVEISSGES